MSVPENDTATAPVAVAVGQVSCVTPAARPVSTGGVAFSPEVGCEQATTCTSESEIALDVAVAAFNVNEADEAATAQLFAPRYEPDTVIEPAPNVSVPENDTTMPPVAVGQVSWVAPAARPVSTGGVALSPEIGWLQATTCTSESVIALAVAVAAFNVNEAVAAATAQLFAPRYVPETAIAPAPIVSFPENWATTAPAAVGQVNCVTPAARPVNTGGVALSPEVGCEQATTCTSESVIALEVAVAAFNVNEAVAAATAQLSLPRYVPDTRIGPAPIVSVPENDTTMPPVATGHAEENGVGGVAFSPEVG